MAHRTTDAISGPRAGGCYKTRAWARLTVQADSACKDSRHLFDGSGLYTQLNEASTPFRLDRQALQACFVVCALMSDSNVIIELRSVSVELVGRACQAYRKNSFNQHADGQTIHQPAVGSFVRRGRGPDWQM